MKKSVDFINPATTASDGRSIAVYDRAFGNPLFSTNRIIAHELGHVIHLNLKEIEWRAYQKALKWRRLSDGSFSRPGKFISSRAKDGAEEDFAENIDAFLFEPDRLKDTVPEAHQWISKKFPKNFKLGVECENAKK